MLSTRNAQIELDILRARVIGIYKHQNLYYLVLNYDEEYQSVDSIRVSEFGAIQTLIDFPMVGKIFIFPDNQSMTDMLNKPHEWYEFMQQFK